MRAEEDMSEKVFGQSVEEALRETLRGGSCCDCQEGGGGPEQEGGGGPQFGPRSVWELVPASCNGSHRQRKKGGETAQEKGM